LRPFRLPSPTKSRCNANKCVHPPTGMLDLNRELPCLLGHLPCLLKLAGLA
jgi:hypothetical protein